MTKVPDSLKATLDSPHASLKHLVMVPGHAIWLGGRDASRATLDSDWILEPAQHGGQVKTYIKHITKGAEVAVRDEGALLVFSGGQTREHAEATEAGSYAALARAGDVYATAGGGAKGSGAPFERVTTEVSWACRVGVWLGWTVWGWRGVDIGWRLTVARSGSQDFALDSMENLLFSIARFKE